MHVETYSGGKDKKITYVRLVRSFREGKKVRKEIVQVFGRLDELKKSTNDPDILEHLKAKYAEQSSARKVQKQSELATKLQAVLSAADTPANTEGCFTLNYAWWPLRKIWNSLTLHSRINYLQKTGCKARYSLNSILSYMVFCKIIDPASVISQFDRRDSFIGNPIGEHATLNACYQSLQWLNDHKDELFKTVNRKLDQDFGKDRASLVFYDVTNTYFESSLTDEERGYEQVDYHERLLDALIEEVQAGNLEASLLEEEEIDLCKIPRDVWARIESKKLRYLRMRGPSKEHRTDLPLVSVALVIDKNGFPMDFEVFAGNSSEFKTMTQAIDTLQAKYHFLKTVLVADRGLNSASNLKMLEDRGFGFLMSQKVSNLGGKLTDAMTDLSGYEDLVIGSPEHGKFKVIADYQKTNSQDPAETVSTTLVFTFSEKRKKRDEAILEAWRKVIEEKAAKKEELKASKYGWRGMVKTETVLPEEQAEETEEAKKEINKKARAKAKKAVKIIVGVDEKIYEKKRKLAGFAGMVYKEAPELAGESHNEKQLGPEEEKIRLNRIGRYVAATYHILNQIEDCFRIMKSHLGFRPVRVWNSDHIRGHIGVCVLSLLVLRLLQHAVHKEGTKLSIDMLIRSLQDAKVAVLKSDQQLLFLKLKSFENLRRNWRDVSNEELVQKIKAGEIKTSFLPEILKSCGLEELPTLSNRADLERCLKTKFHNDEETVTPVIYKLL